MGAGCGTAKRVDSRDEAKGGAKTDTKIKKEVKEGGFGHAGFIVENDQKKKISDFYNMDKKKLGEGSYGSVYKAVNKSTQNTVAVKSIQKSGIEKSKNKEEAKRQLEKFKQEIDLMKMMDHPNIIKLYESFEDKACIYLVMEMCTGGELFDAIQNSGNFDEKEAASVMQHIFRAIYYMHENHVCHRDLKPENFLFVSPITKKNSIDQSLLKIIDFGLACTFKKDQVLTTKAGTPYYVAPQVLAGKYCQLSDIWSCGVIMFVILCGYPPFWGDTDAEVLQKVRLGNFNFKANDWKNISEDAKNLVKVCLKMNPKERCSAQAALEHVWIHEKAPRAENIDIRAGGLMDNLKGFRSGNKLKKAAMHVIASQLGEKDIKALRDVFMTLDSDGDGQLTVSEMREGLANAGLKEIPADLQQIMEEVDSDGSGVIDYTEFLAASLDKKQYNDENVCWAAFRVFDRDGNGVISKEELSQVLGDGDVKNLAMRDMAAMMAEIDTNGDGEIDFKEFMKMMRGTDGGD